MEWKGGHGGTFYIGDGGKGVRMRSEPLIICA